MSSDFMDGGAASFKFDRVGDTITGIISAEPEERAQTDMDTGEPAFWPDGRPKTMWAIKLLTTMRDPDDPQDEGERMIYVRWKSHDAVKSAVRAAGARKLEIGGELTLQFSGEGERTRKGFNPPKFWKAHYVAPPPGFSGNGFMDEPQVQQHVPARQTAVHAVHDIREQLPTQAADDARKSVLDRLRNQQQGRSNIHSSLQADEPPF